jgi:signal peptidase I
MGIGPEGKPDRRGLLRVLAPEQDRFPLSGRRVLAAVGITLAFAVGAVFLLLFVLGKTYVMPSSSMEPTFHCAKPDPGCEAGTRDRILVLRRLGWGRGDVVVFHTPALAQERCGAGGTYVKRVIGLPGDRVSESGGIMIVNGQRLDEPYVAHTDSDPRRSWPRVPEGSVFLVGDNRPQSCDSRVFGSVPKGNVIGRVWAVYWPPTRIGFR